jgi:hypothetical protein
MNIDHDYLKNLLEAFAAAPQPIVNINGLKESGLDYKDKLFVFHVNILDDKDFVKRDDGKTGFGLVRGVTGDECWSVVPLRLTSKGHDFLETIRNKEVWSIIKRDFKEASISTLVDVSKKLFEGFISRKIEYLLK